jgi:hypothetical protein
MSTEETSTDIKEIVADIASSSLPPPTKTKKNVRFSEFSELYVTPRLEYAEVDMSLNEEEYDTIHRDNALTLSYMENGIYPDDLDMYFRGLEGGMVQFYQEKKRINAIAVSAILKQQEEKGEIDPTWISNYYSQITSYSAANAHRIGLWDAQAAAQIK